MIYFIQNTSDKAIKIGFARDVTKRLRSLQTSHASQPIVLGTMPGGRGKEQLLHKKFERLKTVGEWFRPDAQLLHFIKTQKMPFHGSFAARSAEILSRGLSYYRNVLEKSQAEVGKSAGVRQATVSKAEKGARTTEIGTIFDICAALGLELVLRPKVIREFDPKDYV
jgi:HTH-type transcriptional regulator/antitoxin HipB